MSTCPEGKWTRFYVHSFSSAAKLQTYHVQENVTITLVNNSIESGWVEIVGHNGDYNASVRLSIQNNSKGGTNVWLIIIIVVGIIVVVGGVIVAIKVWGGDSEEDEDDDEENSDEEDLEDHSLNKSTDDKKEPLLDGETDI